MKVKRKKPFITGTTGMSHDAIHLQQGFDDGLVCHQCLPLPFPVFAPVRVQKLDRTPASAIENFGAGADTEEA
jgi:hypothetical protein